MLSVFLRFSDQSIKLRDNLISGCYNQYLSVEVVGTSGNDSRLVNRDDSTVRVSHQLGVKVERSGVASAVGQGSSSSVTQRSYCRSSNDSLSGEVLRSGSGHSGLVHRDNGSVWVSHQTVERGSGDNRETSNNNLERRESHVVL